MSDVKCIVAGEDCSSSNCSDHCAAQEIKDLGDGLADGITFSIEAAKDLTQVPKLFRKMALKTILKGAKKEGLETISREFADKYKP
ncbi:hypothetical protein [Oceanicoccus sp. KOV_DT_Chl]|uniref:hypothetical protein n=1 Tax=Oceanicoccus sp. KOV_DT_Chl TaxID=1904639 RepID=UPI000C7DE2CA|nr:hypothetical protein [Oceanicoccus sp. KOV_DT_Chl]